MKELIRYSENKASSLMEVLKSLSYVNATVITNEKALLLTEIKDAVEEMKLIRSRKKKARNAEDF
ncbi:MAG: hypothetical protein ACOVP1_12875 [Bacteroidia bacterium]